jgi:hypothetical protein
MNREELANELLRVSSIAHEREDIYTLKDMSDSGKIGTLAVADYVLTLLAAQAEHVAKLAELQRLAREVETVLDEIAAERKRQISQEGFTHRHDEAYLRGELLMAAVSYIGNAWVHVQDGASADTQKSENFVLNAPSGWPWAEQDWNPKTVRIDLIRAAALIVAGIEALDRAGIGGKALDDSPQ